jgi:hypothetical protein
MRLGSAGRVEEGNRSDLDLHADCCVYGKEVLVFNDFDWEVTVMVGTRKVTPNHLILYEQIWVTLSQKQGNLCS